MLVAEAFFVATNVMAILGASAVVLLVGYGREGWRVLLIGFVSYGLIAHFVILLLGLTGHLNPGAALFATSATTVVLVGFAYKHGAKLAISGRMDQQMIREEGQNILPVAAMLLCGALAVQLFEIGISCVTSKMGRPFLSCNSYCSMDSGW